MQIDDDVNDDVNDDDRKERQRDRERRARREDEDVCGDLFSLNTDERWCLFLLSLSLSLSFRKKPLFCFWGSKTFALLVSSSCRPQKRRYSRFPFLDFETLYDLLKKREKERRLYNCILYYVCM